MKRGCDYKRHLRFTILFSKEVVEILTNYKIEIKTVLCIQPYPWIGPFEMFHPKYVKAWLLHVSK
jgi:hypothetical protein